MKPRKPIPRSTKRIRRITPLKRQAANEVASAKRHGRETFSRYIRIRDAIRTTGGTDNLLCCTCGALTPVKGPHCAQAGHFIAGCGKAILFEERAVHGQCPHCNMTLSGNPKAYEEFMLRRYGQAVVDELRRLSNVTMPPWRAEELHLIKARYTEKLLALGGWPKGE